MKCLNPLLNNVTLFSCVCVTFSVVLRATQVWGLHTIAKHQVFFKVMSHLLSIKMLNYLVSNSSTFSLVVSVKLVKCKSKTFQFCWPEFMLKPKHPSFTVGSSASVMKDKR